MKFETALNCGDTAWVYFGGVRQATVGQIRIEYTNTILYEDEETGYGEPVNTYKEVYMCKEHGIGSGTLFTFGEHIFLTRAACEEANAEDIAKRVAEKQERAAYERETKLGKENMLRMQLAEIEALKLESV